MIKIGAGLYGGRKIKTSSNQGVRPTTSRLKTILFDILQEEVKESICFDGFAGSGNLGLEALSRGAEYVVFNDILRENIKLLEHNLKKLNIASDYYRLIKGDYNRTVIALSKRELKFDLIFLDPPYKLLEVANPLKVIFKREILNKERGIIVLERPVNLKIKKTFFSCFRTKESGKKALDFFSY